MPPALVSSRPERKDSQPARDKRNEVPMSFSRANPSARYRALMDQYREMHKLGDRLNNLSAQQTFDGRSLPQHVHAIKLMINRHAVTSLLDYGCGKAEAYEKARVRLPDGRELVGLRQIWGVPEVRLYDPGYEPFSEAPHGTFDAVISTDVLEHCPEQDMDWIVSEIFGYSRKAVFCTVAIYRAKKSLPTGENAHITLKSTGWWVDLFERTRRAHANRSYFLVVARANNDFVVVEG
jgi:hypothetical protein